MNVTIVGGGFGGVKAALELAEDHANSITLITDKPDFQYYPALYSTATGKSHLQSWVPLGRIFAGMRNVRVVIDTVTGVDFATKTVQATSGTTYQYQTLILALGTVTTYFGIEGLNTYAHGIKSAAEIMRLKRHLHDQCVDGNGIDRHMVVIGAGPTGVELASALGAYIEELRQQYGLPKRPLTIHLVEAAPRVLPRMSERTSRKVTKRLKTLGVKVHANKRVESATADTLMVSGKPIKSHTVIWTSGVANHPLFSSVPGQFRLAQNGKVAVDHYMQAHPDVYVIGDNAATTYSGLAQVALHDGLYVAHQLKRIARGEALQPYATVRPPVVVPVGENWAVFEWGRISFYGWPAALLRRMADFVGYNDILPIGQALGAWRAETVREDDYFTPSATS